MSRSLQGYTTIDKSLTGIITISDGGGTTISEGTVECDDLIVNNNIIVDGTSTFTNLTVTNLLTTNNLTFTGDMNDEITFGDLLGALNQMTEVYTSLAYDSTLGGPTWDDPSATITWPNKMKFNLDLTLLGKQFLLSPSITSTDANFNNKNYLQLCISKNDSANVTNAVCGIDFTPLTTRTAASARIYARQNNNLSADLILATAGSGSLTTIPNERMVILSNGNIGMGVSSPAYKLDVSGQGKFSTGILVTNINSITSTTSNSIFSDKTTGNIAIGSGLTTGVLQLGNVSNASSTTIYGTTNARLVRASSGLDTNIIEPINPSIDMSIGATLNAKIIFGTSTLTSNDMELNAIFGQLKGTEWEVLSAIPAQDNSKKIASTEWVNANTVTQSWGINQSNYNNFNFISNSTDTTSFSFSNICISEDGETGYIFNAANVYKTSDSGSNWVHCHTSSTNISGICCSNTGQYVYYSRTGTNPPLYSSNFGQTFSASTGIVPQNTGHKIFCSYDGSIVCLVFHVTLSGLMRPNYNLNYGSTATWTACQYCPITVGSGVNDLILDGENGVLNSMTIAAGKTGNLDYVHYSNSPGALSAAAWVTKLSQSIWSSLSFKQNGILLVGHAAGVAGIHRSLDSGVTYSVIPSTIGYTINCVDASRDGTHIFFGHSSGFYYSPDSGNTITNFSTTVPNFLQTSQSGKTTMVVPASITDTIYTFFTEPRVNFKTNIHWPKNRVVLQSNLETDYNDVQEVFYPYRTKFVGLNITNNNFDLFWPLYENYVIRPSGNATCFLPEVTERHVGIKITITKMTAFHLNFVMANTNLLWDYGSHTGVTTLSGAGLNNNVTSVTLMASYGLTVVNPFAWIIISSP
jgi:hypothetical protein